MGWIIFAIILVVAAYIGIGWIPKKERIDFVKTGYFNTETKEFKEAAEGSTEPRGYEWKTVQAGQYYEHIPEGYNKRGLQMVSLVFLLIILFGMIKIVPANTVGIKYDPLNGGVQDQTLQEGIHFVHPLVKVYKIKTVQQELSFEEFSVQTSGSEFAWFIVEVKYKVNRANAFEVFRNFQGLPNSSMVRQDVQDAIKTAAEAYNIYGILGADYAELKAEAQANLQLKLDVYGIDLITLNFIDVDGGDQIEAKILERGLAQQQQEIEQQLFEAAQIAQQKEAVEAETARLVKAEQADAALYQLVQEAEAEKVLRELNADAKLYEEEQEALAIEIKADAELYAAVQEAAEIIALGNADAQAYAVVIAAFGSIESYNEYIHYMQWDGTVPSIVMGDSGLVPIWEMGDVIEAAVPTP